MSGEDARVDISSGLRLDALRGPPYHEFETCRLKENL